MKSVNLGSGVRGRLKQIFALLVVIAMGIILSFLAHRINANSARNNIIETPAKLP